MRHEMSRITKTVGRGVVAVALLVGSVTAAGGMAAADVQTHVETLAGEAGGGRLIGSESEARAARYLARELERIGVLPLPGRPGFEVPFDVELAGESVVGRNVVGYLPSASEQAGPSWIVLSAHYDHLGSGEIPGSMAEDSARDEVHPGADDNASGVAAVLTAAERLATQELSRPVILAFWSGSEVSGSGTRAFLNGTSVDPNTIAAHVNLHMVGRMRDYRLIVQAVGTSPVWPRLIEQVNVPLGFDLQTDPGYREPGDVESFVESGIPTVEISTGGHADYHRPSDTPDTLNYEDIEEVARFAALLVAKTAAVAEAPEFADPRAPQATPAGAGSARPFTGTIPDYAGEGEGLKLSGVVPGGPAEAAGLAADDVIVELAGMPVNDAYGYMEALESAEIGVPMKVVYLRGGERHETTITPTARD